MTDSVVARAVDVDKSVASAVDIIIHLGRLRDKSRKVLEITEIRGYEDGEVVTEPIYKFDGESLKKLNDLKYTLKLERSGLL